jgi:hypothetical protein
MKPPISILDNRFVYRGSHESDIRERFARVLASGGNMSEIYVIVCKNDKEHPLYGLDPDGEIVYEIYTKHATLENVKARAESLAVYGECRIGRVVFDVEE